MIPIFFGGKDMKVSEAKIARVAAGLRQMDLAKKVRISPALVSLYESGDSSPTPDLAKKINIVLGKKVYPEDPMVQGER
jgi:ribosome-binding protein aMBF1 (putative translation factor)